MPLAYVFTRLLVLCYSLIYLVDLLTYLFAYLLSLSKQRIDTHSILCLLLCLLIYKFYD